MRSILFGLSASALLLALSGCGQTEPMPAASEASPSSATATTPPAATTPPRNTSTPAPTSAAQPTLIPAAQTAIALSKPQATPSGDLVIVRGEISNLDLQTSTFSIGTNQIMWNDQTQVFALTKRLPITWLRAGRMATAQVRKNEQGQLVAERIVFQPTVLPQTGPPPG